MSRIKDAWELVRSVEHGSPQPTALHRLAHEHLTNIWKSLWLTEKEKADYVAGMDEFLNEDRDNG